jgi:hypothetical protein
MLITLACARRDSSEAKSAGEALVVKNTPPSGSGSRKCAGVDRTRSRPSAWASFAP